MIKNNNIFGTTETKEAISEALIEQFDLAVNDLSKVQEIFFKAECVKDAYMVSRITIQRAAQLVDWLIQYQEKIDVEAEDRLEERCLRIAALELHESLEYLDESTMELIELLVGKKLPRDSYCSIIKWNEENLRSFENEYFSSIAEEIIQRSKATEDADCIDADIFDDEIPF